jgi:hypothetical protein
MKPPLLLQLLLLVMPIEAHDAAAAGCTSASTSKLAHTSGSGFIFITIVPGIRIPACDWDVREVVLQSSFLVCAADGVSHSNTDRPQHPWIHPPAARGLRSTLSSWDTW